MGYSSDEDDGPVVFKRSKVASRPNNSQADAKRILSQNHQAKSSGLASDAHPANGQNLSSQKGKTVPSSKSPQLKSPLASPKASSSSAKSSPLMSPVANSKPSTQAADKSKHSSQQKATSAVKQETQLTKHASQVKDESEDSADDKPLSSKIPTVKGSSNLAKKGSSEVLSPKPHVKEEDSDDEKPLSLRLQPKSNAGASTSKQHGSDGNRPLASKPQQNGSIIKDNQLKKSPTGLNKRPIEESRSTSESAAKKPKLLDANTPTSSKPSSVKAEPKADDDDDDNIPLSQRSKNKAPSTSQPAIKKPKLVDVKTAIKNRSTAINPVSLITKKAKKNAKKVVKNSKYSKSSKVQPGSGDGQKWTSLEHNGLMFPPPYKPHGVKMLYKGKPVDLTPEQEEVATMFAVMLETDYMTKPKFKENFMSDWKKILGRNHVIQNLDDCDFTPIFEWHQREKEKKKQMTTEEKKVAQEEKKKQEEKYTWAIVDGVKEKVGNFRVEPPGLFRGRGEHPKMGKLKRRIHPSDITINIGKDAPVPECPIPGQRWKEVRHDNTVTWLAFWNDPINPKEFKYVFLAASSSLKGQSDKEKYEKARKLKDYIQGIRAAYTKDFGSKDVTKKQVAVATYLIDKLALRAGNEKDDDEADTVGCCTLKVENVEPLPPNILKFDFLGKDSIRYQNEVEVELPVFKAIQQFRSGKKGGDDLFDELDTSKLNAHLKELMPGLTAKVFRTYNASITLDDMLSRETKGGDVAEKMVVYNHANKEVAIICNHQRTVSKSHSAQMTRLNEKINELKGVLEELQTDLARAKKGKPPLKSPDGKQKRNLNPEALEKKIAQTNAKIEKMERDKETKEDLKTVALGTSKINYLDPRITVAWCKRHEVPIEKIFNKSLLAKFAWSMDVDPSFRF